MPCFSLGTLPPWSGIVRVSVVNALLQILQSPQTDKAWLPGCHARVWAVSDPAGSGSALHQGQVPAVGGSGNPARDLQTQLLAASPWKTGFPVRLWEWPRVGARASPPRATGLESEQGREEDSGLWRQRNAQDHERAALCARKCFSSVSWLKKQFPNKM